MYKFNPETKTSSMVAELPYSVSLGICGKRDSDSNTVYIIGGNTKGNNCLAFDMESLTSSVIKPLSFCPFPTTAVEFGCGATKKLFLYGEYFSIGRETLHEFNLRNMRMSPVGHEQYPRITEIGRSVGDGRFMYLIGGYHDLPSTAHFHLDGITQFDPVTLKCRFIPVKNFPVGKVEVCGDFKFSNYYRDAPDCVYVKGLNRIYFFGGAIIDVSVTARPTSVDDIFYIDLSSSSNPSTLPPTGNT